MHGVRQRVVIILLQLSTSPDDVTCGVYRLKRASWWVS